MKPGLARAIIMAVAVLGGGDWPPLAEERRAIDDRRRRPKPSPSLASLLPPTTVSLSPADAERVRLAQEIRARRAAKLDALVAKGAIRRAT